MNVFSAYPVTDELRRLDWGAISDDRVAILGTGPMLFLHRGTNDLHRSYSQLARPSLVDAGEHWSTLTSIRHARLASSVNLLSLFVPNPATCMPDLYPLPLEVCPTPAWQVMRRRLVDDPGVLFCDDLFDALAPANRHSSNAWLPTDSHWSEFGALIVVNGLLARLGVSPIDVTATPIDPAFYGGDLGERFGPGIGFHRMATASVDLPDPMCTFDSGFGTLEGASMGRRVEWESPDAPLAHTILIVGNSFAGSGLLREHLTHWFARIFRRTIFLHASTIPTDMLEMFRPDIVLFQGLERFLGVVPEDRYSVAEIERIYEAPAR